MFQGGTRRVAGAPPLRRAPTSSHEHFGRWSRTWNAHSYVYDHIVVGNAVEITTLEAYARVTRAHEDWVRWQDKVASSYGFDVDERGVVISETRNEG